MTPQASRQHVTEILTRQLQARGFTQVVRIATPQLSDAISYSRVRDMRLWLDAEVGRQGEDWHIELAHPAVTHHGPILDPDHFIGTGQFILVGLKVDADEAFRFKLRWGGAL